MPRLLQVTTVAQTLRAFLLPHARYWRERGWSVDAAAADAASDDAVVASFDDAYSLGWSRNPASLTNFVRAVPRLRHLLRKHNYDIVHVHTPVAAFLTRLTVGSLTVADRPKVIYTAHGFHFHRQGNGLANAAFLGLERLASPWTDRLVVINKEDYEEAEMRTLVAEESLVYMPGIGVDIEAYGAAQAGARRRIREELDVRNDQTLALMIAEFIPRKQHEDVVRAMVSAPQSVVCALAGQGPLLTAMQALAEELGISDRLRFLGYRTDVPDLLAASDVVLLVSLREGLPRSVMEAMAAGVPVIGSQAKGIIDLLDEGAGTLVPVRDPDAIAGALREHVTDPDAAAEVGRRGRHRVEEFGLPKVLNAHAELYEQVLSETRGEAK